MSGSSSGFSRDWLLALHFHIYTYSRRFRLVQDRRVSRRTAIVAYKATDVLRVTKAYITMSQISVGSSTRESFAKRAIACLVQRGVIEVMEPGDRIHWNSDCHLIVRRPRNRSSN